MAQTQLNTLSPKKWVANYSGAEPTIDTTDGVAVGDYAIDSSTTPNLQWKCTVNTDSAPVWIEVTAVVGDKDGIVTRAKNSSCRVYLGTNQTGVVRVTPTRIAFDTEDWDVRSEYSNPTFTAKEAGKYLVEGAVYIASMELNTYVELFVYVNDSSVSRARQVNVTASTAILVSISAMVNVTATQTIEMYVQHTNAGNETLYADSELTYMSIQKID